MSTMPGVVAKPKMLRQLDELSSSPSTKAQFEAMVTALKAAPATAAGIINVGQNHDIITTTEEADHLQNHWFGTWWTEHDPEKPAVIKHGLVKACDIAVDEQKPLDCYWVCSGNLFRVSVLRSPQQVTVLILTPPPPQSNTASFPHKEPIWVAKKKPAAAIPGQDEESAADGVHVVRLRTDLNLP